MASGQRVSSLIYRASASSSSPSPSPSLSASPLSSPYICNSCRVQHQSIRSRAFSSSSHVRSGSNSHKNHKNKNQNLPFTEKLRRKIWGTDNPPGLADPYGGPSFLEKHWAQREQRYREKDEALAQQEAIEAAERELQLEEEERARQQPGGSGARSVSARQRTGHGRENTAPAVAPSTTATGTDVALDSQPGEYKPATTWDGLMHIGHAGHWQDIAPTEQDSYKPWFVNGGSGSLPATSREDVQLLLRQAADQAGVDLFANATAEGDEAKNVASQSLDLTNPDTLQILKSFRILTGFTFPDAFLSSLSSQSSTTTATATYNDLITHYLEVNDPANASAKSKNIYDSLVTKPDLASQPNVLIFPRRETPVDKDKEVGRWKVIEKELVERGLPVLGRLPASSPSSSSA